MPHRPLHPVDDTEEETQSRAERWLMPYIEDSSLWPVLIVVMAALAAFLAPILLFAVYHLNLQAILVALLALWMTGRAIRWEWQARGRPGGLSVVVILIWIVAASAVIYGLRKGWL